MRKYVVDVVMGRIFRIMNYSHVFNSVVVGCRRLEKLMLVDQYASFVEKGITLVLLLLSSMFFAVRQPRVETMTYSRISRSLRYLLRQQIFISSAKQRYIRKLFVFGDKIKNNLSIK
jgi:hypothetical protein